MNKRVLTIVGLALTIFLILTFLISRSKRGPRVLSKADSLYKRAASLQSKGQMPEAIELYQEMISKFPYAEKTAYAWWKLGESHEDKGLLEPAKEAYTRIIANFPNFEQISEAEQKLWDLNTKILFSPVVTDKDIIYKVEPGDTLIKIAVKHNTTVDLIMRGNGLKSDLIRPGQRLKINTVKYTVIVDKSQNSLTLKGDGEIFKVYPIATGKHNSTPVDTFKIVEKLKNPPWYKKGSGSPIPSGSPENVLGTRWLGLSEPGYGIHGGATEEDLGNQLTDGCVRMSNSNVEELFVILPRGTEVTIVD
ncbi:MAG: L,D-transpeptidase family protein [Omnitrophica bacterium]|nr:L,D-transpeptidase family protein [Candidatus Omnitrophota bacterium]